MKYWALFLALCLMGCAPVKSLEELELEAMQSGDWSAVDQRERILARRAAQRGLQCPSGHISYCESFAGDSRCACVSGEQMRAVLAVR